MNAVPMVERCGRHQTGERPSDWALRETRSSEPGWQLAVQTYVPEEAMGGEARPLPPSDAEAWA